MLATAGGWTGLLTGRESRPPFEARPRPTAELQVRSHEVKFGRPVSVKLPVVVTEMKLSWH
jgi:hypothetical protein